MLSVKIGVEGERKRVEERKRIDEERKRVEDERKRQVLEGVWQENAQKIKNTADRKSFSGAWKAFQKKNSARFGKTFQRVCRAKPCRHLPIEN